MGRSWQNIDFILCDHNLDSHDRYVWHYEENFKLMLLTLRALRVIFRIIRVLFWETAWHTHWSGNHPWIILPALNTFLSSLCLKTVFFLRSRDEIVVTHFFSCIIAEKKPKIQTHCGKWSWKIKNKDFWRIKMFSVLLQEWEGWSRFCKRYSRNHGTVLISDETPYLTQHAAPKRKDSALFLWQWPMTKEKKNQFGT